MTVRRFSSSTVYLKVAAFILVVDFILHVAGFAIPRWTTLKSILSVSGSTVVSTYHVGLWQDCSCASELGGSQCECISKDTVAGSLKVVQVLETIGLIGLMISGMTSLVLLFARQDAIRHEKTLKIINIAIVLGSGFCIVIGVVLYAVECNKNYEDLFSYVSDDPSFLDTSTNNARLAVAFLLSTIAGGISFLVCTFLLVLDYRTAVQQTEAMPVRYPNQRQFMVHEQVFMRTQMENLRANAYAQYEFPDDQAHDEQKHQYF